MKRAYPYVLRQGSVEHEYRQLSLRRIAYYPPERLVLRPPNLFLQLLAAANRNNAYRRAASLYRESSTQFEVISLLAPPCANACEATISQGDLQWIGEDTSEIS